VFEFVVGVALPNFPSGLPPATIPCAGRFRRNGRRHDDDDAMMMMVVVLFSVFFFFCVSRKARLDLDCFGKQKRDFRDDFLKKTFKESAFFV
jgi:hypothetical protein